MNIESIAPESTKRVFTLKEANQLLPLVFHITEDSQKLVRRLINSLQAVRGQNLLMASQLEDQINVEMTKWESKMRRLGGLPKGMWLIDFDAGNGYFCWKFPENEIRFWHGYKDGFSGRTEIQ